MKIRKDAHIKKTPKYPYAINIQTFAIFKLLKNTFTPDSSTIYISVNYFENSATFLLDFNSVL